MALAYVTFAQANSASSQVASEAVTIPAGAVAGTACFLLFQSYSGSGGVSTLSVTSTGSTWTQLGSSVYVAGTSSQNNAGLWYLEAASSDAGKIVTCHTSVTNFVNATMVVYSGAPASFIDVSNVTSSASLVSSIPMPSVNTVLANDWALYFAAICNGAAGYSSCTLTGGTVREANFGSDSGVAAAGDSNGSVGAAGTSIGGAGVHFNPSTTGDYISWVIGLAPPGPAITTTSLPPADPGAAYAFTLGVSGGTSPYTWSISSGSLPGWASLNTSTGAITGTPMITDVGSTTFTAEVTDNASLTATQALTLVVLPLAVATSAVPGQAMPGFAVPGEIIVTALTATAGVATATGVASAPAPGWGPATATGTAAAFNPAAQVTALPGAAAGTGAAFAPAPGWVPAMAAGTGAAFAPAPGWAPAAAAGTGAAFLPGWGPGTALAAGTGAAYNPVAQATALPAAAAGTGAASKPGWGPGTLLAAATGAAYNPAAQVTALPAAATGTAAGSKPGWGPGTVTATGTGVAFLPGWGPGAIAAVGTGAASKPGWGPGTAAATGTGAAFMAGWGPVAGLAAGTGTAYAPGTGSRTAGVAAGTGAANLPGWGPAAGLASGTGSAQSPPNGRTAGAATGTGAASLPGWGPVAGAAAGTGAAYAPFLSWTPGAALATATAYNVPFSFSNTVFPGAALGSGDAFLPGWGPVFDIATATGDAIGGDTQPGLAKVSASDQTGALAAGAAYGITPGWVPATAAASADALPPGLSWGAGAALAAAAAGKPAWGPVAGTGTGTGAGYNVALIMIAALPPAAPAAGAAYGPVEVSPALEGYGFGTFPQVPNGAIILSVIANVVWSGSDAGVQAPFYELWDGTSARIGIPVAGAASTTAGHRDSVVFTGVVYSQLATLRLRIYATSLLSNSGATASFDAVSLSVTWEPNTNAAVAPAALRVVPVFPAVSVSNDIAATAGAALATGTGYQALATGFVNATALPAVLRVVPVFPAVRIGIGQTVSPGVLAVVPVLPAIPDVTGPGWAASEDQPVPGTGSWANPGNITGQPDGSDAVWTVT